MERAILILGENLASLPPLKQQDKFLRSELLRAGLSLSQLVVNGDISDATYILALGQKAAFSVMRFENGLKHWSEELGMIASHPVTRALVIPTYHPTQVLRRPGLRSRFRVHLDNFATMVRLDSG